MGPLLWPVSFLNFDIWPRGATISTLDPESSDRGSNPREASFNAEAIHAFAFPTAFPTALEQTSGAGGLLATVAWCVVCPVVCSLLLAVRLLAAQAEGEEAANEESRGMPQRSQR